MQQCNQAVSFMMALSKLGQSGALRFSPLVLCLPSQDILRWYTRHGPTVTLRTPGAFYP